jgi:hypothetical protein
MVYAKNTMKKMEALINVWHELVDELDGSLANMGTRPTTGPGREWAGKPSRRHRKPI